MEDKPPSPSDPAQRRRRWHVGWLAFVAVLVLGAIGWHLGNLLWEDRMGFDPAWFGKSLDEVYSDANPSYVWSNRVTVLWLAALASMPAIALIQLLRKRKKAGQQTVALFVGVLVYSFFAVMASGDMVQ